MSQLTNFDSSSLQPGGVAPRVVAWTSARYDRRGGHASDPSRRRAADREPRVHQYLPLKHRPAPVTGDNRQACCAGSAGAAACDHESIRLAAKLVCMIGSPRERGQALRPIGNTQHHDVGARAQATPEQVRAMCAPGCGPAGKQEGQRGGACAPATEFDGQ